MEVLVKQKTSIHWVILFSLLALILFPVTGSAGPRHGNPEGSRGGPGERRGFHHGNPAGPVGGPGAGPRWRDNPNRIDNPPGPLGGRGTDFGNPPGPLGGAGAGPRWKDNPNRIDNPPGPLGGRGTDWGNPPGPAGGPGTNWGNPPGPAGGPGTNWGEQAGQGGDREREMRQQMRREMMKRMFDANHDGTLEPEEKMRAMQIMRERFGNNPPGPAGGPGTNFGNPPGPEGGPGQGPRFEHPDFNRPNLGPGKGRGLHRGENPPGPRREE